MSTVELYPRLVGALDDVRRQWRWSKLLEGSLLVVGGVAGILILLVAMDNLFKLSTFSRLLLSAVLWGGCVLLVLSLVVRRWLEQRRDDFFAAMVEQQHPELNNSLINALQLGRGIDHGSTQIVEAIVGDAAQATAELEMNDCLNWTPVKHAGIVMGVATLIFLAYALVVPPRFTNGLIRILLPVADVQPYTATVIDEESIRPADGKRFPEGARIEITVQVGGDTLPEGATLFRSNDGMQWRSALMQTTEDKSRNRDQRTFQFLVTEANESFQFYISAGDDRSSHHSVEIVQRPQVEGLSLKLQPPAYTELAAELVDNSTEEIAGLVGTHVELTVQATKSLQAASLESESGQVIDLTAVGDHQSWQGNFIVWQADAQDPGDMGGRLLNAPTRYRFRMVDDDGYENKDSLWHAITLIQDQPPIVSIPSPGRDEQVKPDDVVKLSVASRDDYGLDSVRIEYRVNDQESVHELTSFPHTSTPELNSVDQFQWNLAESGIQPGDLVQYWAIASDRNHITGPGTTQSRRFSILVITPELELARLEIQMDDFAAVLEELIRLQRENRAQTASGIDFETLVVRQAKIRTNTARLTQAMKKGPLQVVTMVKSLEDLYAGLMAEAVRLLESGRDTGAAAKAASFRKESLPVQDEITAHLEELLKRLQRNDKARRELRRIRKKDEASHKELTTAITKLISDLDRLVADEAETLSKLEKMPKKSVDELSEEELKSLEDFDEFKQRWSKWHKGTIDGLTKLPTGFVDDFGMREDVNRVFEEVEEVAERSKTKKMEIPLEEAGASKATEMLEDLELWMPDGPDSLQWVMEEPLDQKPLDIPEMPLPDALEDLIGDLLQDAEEFDQEADDITSAWGMNLNQAGWDVSDGPISNFSAKGKTGNDLPNAHEVGGRAGDGRRGKSSGQMVGDTARGLEGRKTPTRLNNERYEPGKLKEEGRLDPNGATGGGKKAGAGRRGLQGGTPPDFVRDMERLSAKQSSMREKAEQIAKQLDSTGVSGRRLGRAIQLMKSVEGDLRDLRYEDAARKRKIAIGQLKNAFSNLGRASTVQLHQARELPAQLREELLQSAGEAYPKGYETLLENYFRNLAEAE